LSTGRYRSEPSFLRNNDGKWRLRLRDIHQPTRWSPDSVFVKVMHSVQTHLEPAEVSIIDTRRTRLLVVCVLVLVMPVGPAAAINLNIDYSYDTTDFFGSGNPDGAASGLQARSALEAAAGYYSDLLNDSFAAIETPPSYHSSSSNGVVTWQWTAIFVDPTTGSGVFLLDESIAADEYRVYAGAQDLSGGILANSLPGLSSVIANPTGTFSPSEIDEYNQITTSFSDAVNNRGESSGFANWGGTITFDIIGSNWYYDHTNPPTAGSNDFFSAALHELGHALGIGTSIDWTGLVSNAEFVGSSSVAAFGGPVPLDCDLICQHWSVGTTSLINGIAQDASMNPILAPGDRKFFTDLDVAALDDIGWSIVPEPTTGVLGLLAGLAFFGRVGVLGKTGG